MQRPFADVILDENAARGHQPGDEAAHRAAAALADRCDAPTIIALTDMMAFLERCGGQAHVVTLRRKVGIHGENVGEQDTGTYRTEAFHIQYESRDAKVVVAEAPRAVLGIPVEEFRERPISVVEGPAVEPDGPAPEGVEDDLRDQVEAEAAAEAEEQVPALAE